jgi:hypothetical protein
LRSGACGVARGAGVGRSPAAQSLSISCSAGRPKVYGGRQVPSNHPFDDPPAATMPRHKKYDWADKKDLCYRLWVDEEKSLPQVQEYFAQALGVAEDCIPSYVLPFTQLSIHAVTDVKIGHKHSSASSRNGAFHQVAGPGPQLKRKPRSSIVSSSSGN